MNTDLSTSQARIVVGVDGSPQSRQAPQWSARLGQMLGARQMQMYRRANFLSERSKITDDFLG